ACVLRERLETLPALGLEVGRLVSSQDGRQGAANGHAPSVTVEAGCVKGQTLCPSPKRRGKPLPRTVRVAWGYAALAREVLAPPRPGTYPAAREDLHAHRRRRHHRTAGAGPRAQGGRARRALSAQLHLARTVCRRAERRVVALSASAPVAPTLVRFLNRLADLLFVMARRCDRRAGVAEVEWRPRGTST